MTSVPSLWSGTLVSVGIVSLVPLVALGALWVREERLTKLIPVLLSFGVGGLLGGAAFHLLPEAVERLGFRPMLWGCFLAGGGGSWWLERALAAHRWGSGGVNLPPLAALSLLGEAAHNAVDGMVIAAGFLAGAPTGVAATVAVALHEIPHEISDFGILLFGGLSPQRAIGFNLLTGVTSILGAALTLLAGTHVAHLGTWLLPVAAGNFTYIAVVDLLPELWRSQAGAGSRAGQIVLILLGLGLMIVVRRF